MTFEDRYVIIIICRAMGLGSKSAVRAPQSAVQILHPKWVQVRNRLELRLPRESIRSGLDSNSLDEALGKLRLVFRGAYTMAAAVVNQSQLKF